MNESNVDKAYDIADVTPRPWTIQNTGSARSVPIVRDETHIASIWFYGNGRFDEGRANAAHIVRCVNAHEALVEALKECVAYIEMKLAHTGCQSVDQIMSELKNVKSVAQVETYHHCGCAKTTRKVDLNAARAALKAAGVNVD